MIEYLSLLRFTLEWLLKRFLEFRHLLHFIVAGALLELQQREQTFGGRDNVGSQLYLRVQRQQVSRRLNLRPRHYRRHNGSGASQRLRVDCRTGPTERSKYGLHHRFCALAALGQHGVHLGGVSDIRRRRQDVADQRVCLSQRVLFAVD